MAASGDIGKHSLGCKELEGSRGAFAGRTDFHGRAFHQHRKWPHGSHSVSVAVCPYAGRTCKNYMAYQNHETASQVGKCHQIARARKLRDKEGAGDFNIERVSAIRVLGFDIMRQQ